MNKKRIRFPRRLKKKKNEVVQLGAERFALQSAAKTTSPCKTLNANNLLSRFIEGRFRLSDYIEENKHELDYNEGALLAWMGFLQSDASMRTLETYVAYAVRMLNHFECDAPRVSPSDAHAYIAFCRERGLAKRTICLTHSVACLFYDFLEKESAGDLRNPFRDVSIKNIRRSIAGSSRQEKFLNDEDLKTLLDHVRQSGNLRNLAIFEILFGCGLRLEELVRLNIRNLHKRRLEVAPRVWEEVWHLEVLGKGGKTRFVHVPDFVFSAIDKYFMEHFTFSANSVEQIEHSFGRHPLVGHLSQPTKRLTRAAVQKIFERIARPLLGKKVSPHWGRHTCITNWRKMGATSRQMRAQSGHSDTLTLDRYGDQVDLPPHIAFRQ